MGYFDYSREPKSDIAFVDMKSFYASVECVERGLHPLKTSLCVMSRAENANGLILASSPMFKKVFGKNNVSRSYDLPFDIKTRKFNYYVARRQGLPITLDYVRFIEEWARITYVVPPRMDLYIEKNVEIQHIFQNYASPDDILRAMAMGQKNYFKLSKRHSKDGRDHYFYFTVEFSKTEVGVREFEYKQHVYHQPSKISE